MLNNLARHLSGASLFIYSILIATFTYLVVQNYLPPTNLGEYRDQVFYFSLPIVFELAFLVTWVFGWVVRKTMPRQDSDAEAEAPSFGSLFVSQLPILIVLLFLLQDFLKNFTWQSVVVLIAVAALHITWVKLPRPKWRVVTEWIIAALIAFFILKVQVFSLQKNTHHWSFYLGPLYSYRENGVLLWDTPSQYGFLNIIFVSTLASLFSLEAMTAFGVGLALFQILALCLGVYLLVKRADFSPITSVLFAGILFFFYAGWLLTLEGSTAFPAVTAFRFLPAFIALFALDTACRTQSKAVTLVTAVLAAVACLWSAESAAYTIPAILGFFLCRIFFELDYKFFTKPPFQVILLTPVLVLLFLAGYVWALGTPIDPQRFLDYPRAYSSNRGTITIAFDWWTVFLVAILALCYFFVRSSLSWQKKRSLYGVLFFSYAYCVSTYFVARSHENNVRNLLPWLVVALACCVPVGTLPQLRAHLRSVMFTICFLLLGNIAYQVSMPSFPSKWGVLMERFTSSNWMALPPYRTLPAAVRSYIDQNLSGKPITIFENEEIIAPVEDLPGKGFYLPATPLAHIQQLEDYYRQPYVNRVIERKPLSYGICTGQNCGSVRYLFKDNKNFTVTEIADIEGWKVLELKASNL